MNEYLNTVIRQFMVQFKLVEKMKPACNDASHLPELENFFQRIFIPSAVDMISNEIKIGVPSGRIVDVIGLERRFMMSRRLINLFLGEYKNLIHEYIKRDFGEN